MAHCAPPNKNHSKRKNTPKARQTTAWQRAQMVGRGHNPTQPRTQRAQRTNLLHNHHTAPTQPDDTTRTTTTTRKGTAPPRANPTNPPTVCDRKCAHAAPLSVNSASHFQQKGKCAQPKTIIIIYQITRI